MLSTALQTQAKEAVVASRQLFEVRPKKRAVATTSVAPAMHEAVELGRAANTDASATGPGQFSAGPRRVFILLLCCLAGRLGSRETFYVSIIGNKPFNYRSLQKLNNWSHRKVRDVRRTSRRDFLGADNCWKSYGASDCSGS